MKVSLIGSRWFRLGALLTAATLLAPHAHPEEPSVAAPPLRVGVSPVFPPMVFKQQGQLVGIEVDLARALGERLGRAVTFVELLWEDQIEALQQGRIDIIMSSMSITPARAFVIDFSLPYLSVGQGILVRREDEGKYLLGMPHKPSGPVGVLKATTGEFLVQRDFPKARRRTYKSEADAVQALKKKRIDLFITDSPLVWYLAGVHAAEGLSAVSFLLSQEQLAWGVRKGDDSLRNAANGFLQEAMQDGTVAGILRRWTGMASR
jgi:ABC-type amino acid transport substrate-binding protein